MDDSALFKLFLVILCLIFSAFFSSAEAAFLSVQRIRIRHLASLGIPGASQVATMAEHPEQLLPTILLGNNLVNTAAAALGTAVALSFLRDVGTAILVSTVGVTLLLLVLGELVPKIVASRHAEGVALLYAGPLRVISWLLLPLAAGLHTLSRAVARLFGGRSDRSLVTEEELKTMISVGREVGVVDRHKAAMLEKVFRFGDRQVREVMTPRTETVWIEHGTSLEEFLAVYTQHQRTRFPVHRGDRDNVVGILSVKDVLKAIAQGRLGSKDPVTRLLRPAYFVPETKLIGQLFSEMQQGQQMAIVVDEFGGVAGLVTLKRLVEEVVGRVSDEGVPAPEGVQAIDERTYRVDAGTGIQEANDALGVRLPEGDYETVAGFILERLGHIPREGEVVEHGDVRLSVARMEGVKIEEVTVTTVVSPPQYRASQEEIK